jgi:Spy/CpxP family protein refolding chaperone
MLRDFSLARESLPEDLLQKLSLTQMQKEKIVDCGCESCKCLPELSKELRQKIRLLKKLLIQKQIDKSCVCRLAEEVSKLHARKINTFVHKIILVKETLSPKQQQMLEDLLSNK